MSQGLIDTTMNRETEIVGKVFFFFFEDWKSVFFVVQVGESVCSLKVIFFLLLCSPL